MTDQSTAATDAQRQNRLSDEALLVYVASLENALRRVLGADPNWDADAQHDYGFRYDGPFAPTWVRDIASDALVGHAKEGDSCANA